MIKTNNYTPLCLTFILSMFIFSLAALEGCGEQRHSVIAATGTNIGVDISQNPANQAPQAKLGYQRTELAIVPTNRSSDGKEASYAGGTQDVPDVLIELKYAGIFDWGTASGIYQRLAVGPNAVKQPGAAVMFIRDAKGEISPEGVSALGAAVGTYSPDKNSACIETWVRADKKHLTALKKWMADNHIKTDVTIFLDSKEFASQREAAIKEKDLAIPCESK